MAHKTAEARRAYWRKWRSANLERARGYSRRSYARHHEELLERQRAQRATPEFRERNRGYQKKYYAAHRVEKLDQQRLHNAALKAEMIAAYGGSCSCCGESAFQLLTIDHVYHDGKRHRAAKGENVYADLKQREWPQDGFRLLCMNCNWGTRFGAPCPHVERRLSETALAFTAYEDNRDG